VFLTAVVAERLTAAMPRVLDVESSNPDLTRVANGSLLLQHLRK